MVFSFEVFLYGQYNSRLLKKKIVVWERRLILWTATFAWLDLVGNESTAESRKNTWLECHTIRILGTLVHGRKFIFQSVYFKSEQFGCPYSAWSLTFWCHPIRIQTNNATSEAYVNNQEGNISGLKRSKFNSQWNGKSYSSSPGSSYSVLRTGFPPCFRVVRCNDFAIEILRLHSHLGVQDTFLMPLLFNGTPMAGWFCHTINRNTQSLLLRKEQELLLVDSLSHCGLLWLEHDLLRDNHGKITPWLGYH